MSGRTLQKKDKIVIAARQYYKCANKPGKTMRGLDGYQCPLWKQTGEDVGSFDESGYDIDHIVEFAITADDSPNNLQALCKSCHIVKTRRFNSVQLRGERDTKNKRILEKVAFINSFIVIDKTHRIEDHITVVDETIYDMKKLRATKKNYLHREAQLAVNKMRFMNNYGITDCKKSDEFRRFAYGYYTTDPTSFEMMFGYQKPDNMRKHSIKIIVDILNLLLSRDEKSYCLEELIDIKISSTEYDAALVELKESAYFVNQEENQLYFAANKKGGSNYANSMPGKVSYTITLQSILSTFFIIFKTNHKKRINGILKAQYLLTIDPDIQNIIDFKYGRTDSVQSYPTIFSR